MPWRIPRWLEALVAAMERRPDAGMCASQVRLFGEHRLDSAGMLVARDGSSKQRGHGRPPEDFPVAEEVLLPSGSAALYRRAMLERDRRLRRRFLSLLRRHGSRAARALGGLEMPVCAGRGGGASLLALGGTRIAAEGLLRGAQPAVRAGEELSRRRCCCGRAVRFGGALSLARWSICCEGTGQRGALPRGGQRRTAHGVVRPAARIWRCWRMPRGCWRQRREIRRQARITPRGLPAPAARATPSRARRVAEL